jgi:predicted Zn finger-like uncharacterized protein
MILTCPECATRYFVDDGAVAGGRTVRCTGCGASWRAAPPLDLGNGPTPASGKPEVAAAAAPLTGQDLPRVYRARVEEQKRVREAAATGAVWAGLAGGFALIIGAALMFRADLVRIWPKSASAFAAVGMPVNRYGLQIEQVSAQPALQDGRMALVVSGLVRNIQSKGVAPPPLEVALLDKSGVPLKRQLASAGEAEVNPASSRAFTATLIDPPTNAAEVRVRFVGDAARTPRGDHSTPPSPSSQVVQLRLRPASPDTAPPSPAPAQLGYGQPAHATPAPTPAH